MNMVKKLSFDIRGLIFLKFNFLNNKTSQILTGIAITLLLVITIFFLTGRIFLEFFQWLLLPFPKKWPITPKNT